MKLAAVQTRALLGLQSPQVTVEVHLANGLPGLTLVGLPETAVRESKDRVRAAIINSRFEFPARRITVNLAPADLPKDGSRYDLAIALGILAASEQIDARLLDKHVFIGELALSGDLRAVNGSLPTALSLQDDEVLVCPEANASEAALVEDIQLLPATDLITLCNTLSQEDAQQLENRSTPSAEPADVADMRDVRGQQQARRALEIAAAGRHNLLMVGPPGTGKSMLASRLPGILPPMQQQEALQTAAIHSISHHGFAIQQWRQRPFRAPHHSASGVALVGGGSKPAPGEISLAHNGVLFLDELTEFSRHALDVLREPLETGQIVISRAARQAEFPARFQLIAAMNPCPQGYSCDGRNLCECTQEQQKKHRARISAPLLDRIDMHVEVPRLDSVDLHATTTTAESSEVIRARVNKAWQRQIQRSNKCNAELSTGEIEQCCAIDKSGQQLLQQASDRLRLSARAYHRILKLARTIADLAGSDHICIEHLSEAISYRSLDRFRQ